MTIQSAAQTAVTADTLAAARLLLAQMGITAADLVDTAPAAPTFAEVIPRVRARLSAGTARTYGTHFDLLESRWPDRSLTEPTRHELDELAYTVQTTARSNRASRGGTSALEHVVSAARCVYRYAEEAGWVRPQDNPARRLPIPSRRASHRYAIPSGQVAEIRQVAATSGDDPELDALILRFTSRPRAVAVARWRYVRRISIVTSAWCSCGKRVARIAGSRCRRH
ncbi:hypothetical protein [Nocardia sp. NBC_00403]|uniref:hypothetical protein n=1 Tax=Nocardia sp. NBC_00403 TaxID=2975990 RepID=UPI002E23ADD2